MFLKLNIFKTKTQMCAGNNDGYVFVISCVADFFS